MGSIFTKSKKPESRITEHDQAVLKLKKQRDELKRYQKRINLVLEKDRQVAKKLLREGKEDRARLLLRKKKYQEGLLARTDGQLDNLEQLVHDLEFAQVEKQVLDGLKSGNAALKKANEMFSIEEIEQIMDDTAEAVEKQREIEALISGQLSPHDEHEAEEELKALLQLEEEGEEEATAAAGGEFKLPEVPSHELPESNKRTEAAKKKQIHGSAKVAVEAS